MTFSPLPDGHSTGLTKIDAHHHLWRYNSADFDWIPDEMHSLRQDFLVADLNAELQTAEVDGTVIVQARQTIQETEWLLFLAEQTPAILGVVGWLPLSSPEIHRELDRFGSNTLLKGLRHVVQGEPEGFLDSSAFNAGVALLQETGLVYDLLILSDQLEGVIRFVDRFPSQMFVLDHMAKPPIAANEIEPWRSRIRELARRPNVTCKLSGLVTETNSPSWTRQQLDPYVEVVIDCFGPHRIMVGSDWPVLTAFCSYNHWWQLIQDWTAPLSADERNQIKQGTAARVYRLTG